MTEEIAGAVLLGFLAGVSSGLLGIGGGVLFIPGLVFFLSQSQVEAEATALLAMIPVAMVGTLRQRRYGNLRAREGLLIGLLALPGAVAGSLVADALDERVLELMFAGVLVVIATGLAKRAFT